MANKRTLKKSVNNIAGSLFTECIIVRNFIPNVNENKVNELMVKVLYMQDEFIRRINHPEPGNIKGYYKKLHTDFNEQIDAIVEEISNIHEQQA